MAKDPSDRPPAPESPESEPGRPRQLALNRLLGRVLKPLKEPAAEAARVDAPPAPLPTSHQPEPPAPTPPPPVDPPPTPVSEAPISEEPPPARVNPAEALKARAAASVSPIPPGTPRVELPAPARFQPREPRTWEEVGIDALLIEPILLRYLLIHGGVPGRTIAADLALAVPLVKELLEGLKQQKLVQHRGATAMGDFVFELTETGVERAMELRRQCAYVGPAPVPYDQYLASVREQVLSHRRPTPDSLQSAFSDLVVPDGLLDALGPAITSGRALLLHGEPGNGKTSFAERITRCFGDTIWIPQTLWIDGHLVKLFDPATHEVDEPNFKPLTAAERIDRRWVRIKRPTVVAGGELTLEMLEVQANPTTNVAEPPLQLKANCGTLVIDDFGRQRIEPQVLLNRWIFPLERRLDFLRLPDGRKIACPFEPLLVFSTNLEPRHLVDEAFLRRIPYKIRVPDPTDAEFRLLLEMAAADLGVEIPAGSVDYLVEHHYRKQARAPRFCHPRDLLLQIANQAAYERTTAVATREAWDRAAAAYFGLM